MRTIIAIILLVFVAGPLTGQSIVVDNLDDFAGILWILTLVIVIALGK